MPSYHHYKVHKKFEGYHNSLEKMAVVLDWRVFEVARMCDETLVNHPRYTEAMMMNILIEIEMRLQKLETE